MAEDKQYEKGHGVTAETRQITTMSTDVVLRRLYLLLIHWLLKFTINCIPQSKVRQFALMSFLSFCVLFLVTAMLAICFIISSVLHFYSNFLFCFVFSVDFLHFYFSPMNLSFTFNPDQIKFTPPLKNIVGDLPLPSNTLVIVIMFNHQTHSKCFSSIYHSLW